MKKKAIKILTASVLMLSALVSNSQTTSTFEALQLNTNSYWNGSAMPLGTIFTDGNAIFPNYYDTSWGGFWSSGFAYSNIKDSTTSGIGNMYAARTAEGYNGSSNYIVSQQNSLIKLTGNAVGKVVSGFYITNSTYAAISMRDGDMFSKKFGGVSGNDADWFKLVIRKYFGGILSTDSVEFYLADFRFQNNAQDYILTSWQWVDLTSLGNSDSLLFTLSSSDVGQWGMNTPAFFCIDNFTSSDAGVGIAVVDSELQINIFPNPATNYLKIEFSKSLTSKVEIYTIDGSLIYENNFSANTCIIPVNDIKNSFYLLKISNGNNSVIKKFLKQ